MKKPKSKKRVIMDYHDMAKYIEKKYHCDLRDYAAHKNGVKSIFPFNCDHEEKWKCSHFPRLIEFRKNPVPNYGLNKAGLDFYKTPEGIRWFTEVQAAYNAAPDGKAKELPFWCFWHFIIDTFEISNGSTRLVNWADLATCGEEWQKEICELFVKEFGAEDMYVEFSW